MAAPPHLPVISKRRSLAVFDFVLPYEQVNADTEPFVLNDFFMIYAAPARP
jgi:hypothetical protein